MWDGKCVDSELAANYHRLHGFTAGLRVLALPEVGSVRGGWFLFRDRYLRMYTHMHAITTVKKEGTGLKERGAG